jgi:hypothetical protein
MREMGFIENAELETVHASPQAGVAEAAQTSMMDVADGAR